jgi:hypothetical protein
MTRIWVCSRYRRGGRHSVKNVQSNPLPPKTYRIVTGTDCTGMMAASQMTHVTSSGRATSYRRLRALRLGFGGVYDCDGVEGRKEPLELFDGGRSGAGDAKPFPSEVKNIKVRALNVRLTHLVLHYAIEHNAIAKLVGFATADNWLSGALGHHRDHSGAGTSIHGAIGEESMGAEKNERDFREYGAERREENVGDGNIMRYQATQEVFACENMVRKRMTREYAGRNYLLALVWSPRQ